MFAEVLDISLDLVDWSWSDYIAVHLFLNLAAPVMIIYININIYPLGY